MGRENFPVRQFEKDNFYHIVLEAFGQGGCPVCRLKAKASHDYLELVLYEAVNAVDFRRRFRKAGGFCARHTREMTGFKQPLGASILCRVVLGDHLEGGGAARSGWFSRRRGKCPACIEEEGLEADVRAAVLGHILDEGFQAAYRASDGLCVAHYRRIAAGARRKARRILAELEGEKVRVILDGLDEFTRKRDYRFSHEPKGRERRAWLDAIDKISGGDAGE